MKNDNLIQDEFGTMVVEMTESEKAETAMITRNSYLKEKYRMSLKVYTKRKIQEYAHNHADWHAKEVLVGIMQGYNPELPPIVLLEMTQLILTEWEKKKIPQIDLIFAE